MKHWILVIWVALSFTATAQTGYKIEFQVKGWKDTTAYLGSYYGEQTRLNDTARVNSTGHFFFDNAKALPQGVYFIVLNKSKIFDFVISANQRFSIETSTDDFSNATVKGDPDNTLFFENLKHNVARGKEADPYIAILRDSTLKEDQKKEAREKFSKISEQVMSYQKQLIEKNPATMTARLLKTTQTIEVPPAPKKADGTIDSTFQLRYYREHFFDNFDLADDALIRLPRPIYQEKVKEYLNKLYVPVPDTIMMAIERMVEKAKKNPETYKYMVWNCIFLYQNPEIMGLDEVFVRLYDKYFDSGAMDYWIAASMKKSVKDYADKLRTSLVGKTGANLIMQDQALQPKSMYDIKNKYTILWIYDPECGHCKEETPKLVEFYNKNRTKFDVQVYSVASDTSLVKMKNFIKTMKIESWVNVNGPRSYLPQHYSKLYYAESTPAIYILDRSHKIIAKKLPVKQLEDFFTRHEKFVQNQKTGVQKSTKLTP
jgi:thiol-disulfide isomerase/thioredoxin